MAIMRQLLTRLLREDFGQDLIEYALLAAFIGTVGIVAWQSVGTGIGNAYSGWDSGVQGLYNPPDPGAGS
jgi:Flp pilus assembly pilin Flp